MGTNAEQMTPKMNKAAVSTAAEKRKEQSVDLPEKKKVASRPRLLPRRSNSVPVLPSSMGKPPRPEPLDTSTKSDGARSREALRKDLNKRRGTLLPTEQSFLEDLLANGNEAEVETAREKLCDEGLFFFVDDGWNGSEITIGRETSTSPEVSFDNPAILDSSNVLDNSNTSGTSKLSRPRLVRQQSAKAAKHLQNRRKSEWHGKIWKAHEGGLAVSNQSSRKSVLKRSTSYIQREAAVRRNRSLLSLTTEALILDGGVDVEDAIFRQRLSALDLLSDPSSRLKAGSLSTLDSAEEGDGSSAGAPGRLSEPERPVPAAVVRLKSDGSRKSVTFKVSDEKLFPPRKSSVDVPKGITTKSRQFSVESIGMESLVGAEQLFSSISTVDSSSFPRLKKAAPIRSNSMSSIPSIRRALPLRSASFASVASLNLHRARPIRSDSIAASSVSSHASQEGPAWAAPVPTKDDTTPKRGQLQRHPSQDPPVRPVLFRRASRNAYQGEGIEVTEFNPSDSQSSIEKDSLNAARKFNSLLASQGDISAVSLPTISSFDDAVDYDKIFREGIVIPTSLSEEEMKTGFRRDSSTSLYHASDQELRPEGLLLEESWDMHSSSRDSPQQDAWNVLKDDYAVGYGAGDTLPFRILGTSATDHDAIPHVLSPPLMESLQNFFPYAVSEDNMWMKYSLIKHGASMHTLLQRIRGARYTIFAIETSDGEVLGSFTASPWRKNWNYFGTGESFLWRMRQSRNTPCFSIIDQAQLESELDVYPWTGDNNCVQLCTHDKIAVGGGVRPDGQKEEGVEYGFGFAIDRDLLHGTSEHCATFGSPPLCKMHQDGSPFEIVNLEVWTTTPCFTLADAEKLELGKLFLETHSNSTN